MHPLFLLPFLTFLLLIGYLVWNWVSTRNSQDPAKNKSGIGGPNDPMS